MLSRRLFLGGLIVAPAIVRASSLDGLGLLRPASSVINYTDFDEFQTAILKQIARSIGLPYEVISGDFR